MMKLGSAKRLMGRVSGLPIAAAILVSGCSTTGQSGETASASDADMSAILTQMMAGESQVQGEELDARVQEASASPLGSAENPVRAHMPPGQRAYLSRLRCADLSRPEFYRAGSAGMSPYGNIVDVYIVTCADSEPAKSEIYIDMYHRGYVEEEAVPGFGIVGGKTAGPAQ